MKQAKARYSCLILFFSSLAGIGYVAPDEIARTVEFLPGKPVFDLAGRQAMEKRMEEQKALESQWARMKRPKDVSSLPPGSSSVK